MHRGKIVRFALAVKAEGMPLPNPPVDGANDLPHPLSTDAKVQSIIINGRSMEKPQNI
jgi:hypothetical protein